MRAARPRSDAPAPTARFGQTAARLLGRPMLADVRQALEDYTLALRAHRLALRSFRCVYGDQTPRTRSADTDRLDKAKLALDVARRTLDESLLVEP